VRARLGRCHQLLRRLLLLLSRLWRIIHGSMACAVNGNRSCCCIRGCAIAVARSCLMAGGSLSLLRLLLLLLLKTTALARSASSRRCHHDAGKVLLLLGLRLLLPPVLRWLCDGAARSLGCPLRHPQTAAALLVGRGLGACCCGRCSSCSRCVAAATAAGAGDAAAALPGRCCLRGSERA
jgi:hypothetical protein